MPVSKTFFILTLSVFLIACTQSPVQDEDDEVERNAEEIMKSAKPGDFEIIVIEECEYLLYTESFGNKNRGFGFMAHKGNCKNPIHIYNTSSQPDTLDINQ